MKKNESAEDVIEDLKKSLKATADHLAFLENIGKYSFRRQVQKSDLELSEYIQSQNLNILQMTRECLLAWRWIKNTGRLPMFEDFRAKIQAALTEDQKKVQNGDVEDNPV